MRGPSLPERRRAEFARLTEIDDAVDAFMDRDEFGELAPDVRELVSVAVKALLGIVRRFEGHELTLELQWLPGTTVAVAYRDGSPSLALVGRPPGRQPALPGRPAVDALPGRSPADVPTEPPRDVLERPGVVAAPPEPSLRGAGLPDSDPPETTGDVVVPSPRLPRPPAGPATTWLPRREPPPDAEPRVEPVVETPVGAERPRPARRALREDVAAELAALRAATRRQNRSRGDT